MAKINVPNRTIFCHDNLGVLENINTACVDLIYLDPPFNKNKKFVAPITSSAKGAEFSDIFRKEDVKDEWLLTIRQDEPDLYEYLKATKAIGNNEYTYCYLCYMAIRLIECKRILKPTGSIYLHCDPTMSHYLKVVMDCIFEEDNFRNEVIWHYRRWSNVSNHFQKMHDIILFYAKDKKSLFNVLLQEYSVPEVIENTVRGVVDGKLVRLKDEEGNYIERAKKNEGVAMHDVWNDINFIAPTSKERTGYPTQKPLALLDRIIKASTKKGDIVLDPFCGCATTCVAAEKLGRQWIGVDISNMARELVNKRLNTETEQGELVAGKIIDIKPAEVVPPKRTDEGAKDKKQKYVYVISNPQYKNEYKVGVASDMKKRLGSYQTSDPNRSYKEEFSLLTPYFNEIEIKIHEDFDNQHEWVKGDLKEIIKAIESHHRKGRKGTLI